MLRIVTYVGLAWTEWDPAKEDEYIVDPLGLQNFAEMLANSILPGITSRTLKVRYYSFICWCLKLIEENEKGLGISESEWTKDILGRLMLLERLLVLSIVAYHKSYGREAPDDEKPLLGVDKARDYLRRDRKVFDLGEFPFLRNQRFQGCFGVYKTSLENLGFVEAEMYRVTRCDKTSGEALAKAFCNTSSVSRAAIKAIMKGKVRLDDLIRLGKALSLSPHRIHDGERRIFRARFLDKYSPRYASFKSIADLHFPTDLETLDAAMKETKGYSSMFKQFRVIVVYEYSSLAVGTIFNEVVRQLESGTKLSDIRITERKFNISKKTVVDRILYDDSEKLELALQLAEKIAGAMKDVLLPYMGSLVNDEYLQALFSFMAEVQTISSSAKTNQTRLSQLIQAIVGRHQHLKGPWSWITEDPLTREVVCNKTSEVRSVLHSYRTTNLRQIMRELQEGK